MIWLVTEIILAVIVAAMIGFIFGWWIRASISQRTMSDKDARIAQLKLERDNAAANRPVPAGPVTVPKAAREAATNTSGGGEPVVAAQPVSLTAGPTEPAPRSEPERAPVKPVVLQDTSADDPSGSGSRDARARGDDPRQRDTSEQHASEPRGDAPEPEVPRSLSTPRPMPSPPVGRTAMPTVRNGHDNGRAHTGQPSAASVRHVSTDGASREKARTENDKTGRRPPTLEEPRGGNADNLRRVSGIGPKIEKTLHGLGVYHFDQIAAWTDDHVTWIDGYLKFRGRIGRERWIDQAKVLAAGGETESSERQNAADRR